jgi:DNA polymerase
MVFMVLPEPPQVRLSDLHEHIRTHRGCGFAICEDAINLVPGEGPEDADVMVVGEAPGRLEDEQGRPFVGRAGQLLSEVLAEAGLERGEVFVTNVVKARPPGNRDPTKAEVAHWMPVLEQQLALVAPKLVVPLGRHALAHFAPAARIGEAHGRALTERGRELFPLYHPAAALRSTKLRETLLADARALGELARLRAAPSG